MIRLRSLLFNIAFFGVTLVMIWPAALIRLVRPTRVLPIAMLWARVVLWLLRVICGTRYEVAGWENVPPGAALLASRHQSAFDTVVWLAVLPYPCYVLKRELRALPIYGALTEAAGMITVDRADGANALRGLLRDGERAKAEGRQIVIFPEGTRGEPGRVLALQPGIAALASRLRLPVIPVATDSGLYWGRRAFRKHPGVIKIVIGSPISPETPRPVLMTRLAAAMAMPGEGL
jgi:1-acyl-sn-glycerol-3-phosphate acyltransferase